MKKAVFIDRDGTLIVEPPEDFQVDSLEKLELIPKVIQNLRRLRTETGFELVIVTNQEGLGTPSFPEETFWPAHNKMLKTFEGEGVTFDEILIDRSLPHENAPTRKPGTGMLLRYTAGGYDLAASFVVGDRPADVQLAANLGAKAIYFSRETLPGAVLCTDEWDTVARFIISGSRTGRVRRKTAETDVSVFVNLDGSGKARINTGLGFLDHMIEQLAKNSRVDMTIEARGDLKTDEHHTVEDTALALGEAVREALGGKRGIERYGFLLPMDESLAQVALDFSGRSLLSWDVQFVREKVGEVPTELFHHFFKSFCDAAGCTLHVQARGDNEHHKIEAVFKAVGRAVRMAVSRGPCAGEIPSTKGTL